jgi:hypothetical protein
MSAKRFGQEIPNHKLPHATSANLTKGGIWFPEVEVERRNLSRMSFVRRLKRSFLPRIILCFLLYLQVLKGPVPRKLLR